MITRYQSITELYQSTSKMVVKHPQAWQDFLSSACRNYKCRFDEQLLIFAQRPDAIAVLELEKWNQKFHRWVNKNSKSIAVFDLKGRSNTLKYYFDISDTHEGRYASHPVPIWSMQPPYEQEIRERLEDCFGEVQASDFASMLMEIAQNAVEDHLQDYLSQLKEVTPDSFLEELDDFNLEIMYRELTTNSVAYMLLHRCSCDASEYFEPEDFIDITNFNTPETLNGIGIATSDIAEMALREISFAIRNVQREGRSQNRTVVPSEMSPYDKKKEQPERSEDHERNHVYQAGRLSNPQPNITDRARNSTWQIRFDTPRLFRKEQASDVSQSINDREIKSPSTRDRTDSTSKTGNVDEAANDRAERDRSTQRENTDAVGRSDEQHSQSSRGEYLERTDIQLNQSIESNLSGDELPELLAEEFIFGILFQDQFLVNKIPEIKAYFAEHSETAERTAYVKASYNQDYSLFQINQHLVGYVAQEDGLLMWEGNYLTRVSESKFTWKLIQELIADLIECDNYDERNEVGEIIKPFPTVDEQIEMIVEAEEKKASAFSFSKEEIDEVLVGGSSFQDGKYRIYQQFQKNEDNQKNAAFLKKEYGTGGGTHTFQDGVRGSTWHDAKGIGLDKSGSLISKPDMLLKWPEVERRLRELIKDDRYLNQKEKEHFPDYLEQEIQMNQKIERQKYIESVSDLPVEEKRDTLSLRFSHFIRNLDQYEKDFLANVELTELADVTSEQMEQYLRAPETVQKLLTFLDFVRGRTMNIYSRGNAWRFSGELLALYPLHYKYQAEDIVYLGVDKYEILAVNEEFVFLRNEIFPLFSREYRRAEFEEKLQETSANDHLKTILVDTLPEKQEDVLEEALSDTQEELPLDNKPIEPAALPVKLEIINTQEPSSKETLYNYQIVDDHLGTGGAKEKFRNNITAIQVLHKCEIEHRLATPEEQKLLSKYVGWGGLSAAFDERNATRATEYKELQAALSQEEYRLAMESTLTAFYTQPIVIKAMYQVLANLGFQKGNLLEPSCGTGNFFGLLPENMKDTKLYGIELDSITGRIAKQQYQKAKISIQGFEETNLPDNHFDVILGNVPFGDFRVNDAYDKRYEKHKFLIHDYFFAKALDKVRTGGVILFITSKGTMDKENPMVRKYIAQRAELLGAIRLPNTAFKANAGTEVTADILVLQKRERIVDIEPDWVHLDKDENGITMNQYFVNHPNMILGEMVMESTRFGYDSTCKARTEESLEVLLQGAVQKIQGEIETYEMDEISDEQDYTIPANPNVKNFSYTLVEGKVYFRENLIMTPVSISVTAENRIKGLLEIRDCVRKLITYQTEDYPEEMIYTEQKNLNRLYDMYVAKYGQINSRGNYMAFATDESYFLLCSLEILDDEGNFKRKADMFRKRTIKPHRSVSFAETASEALAISIGEKASIDLMFMEQLTGKSPTELIQDLHGVIFKVPNTEPIQYVTADEYLSGNVRSKLVIAKLAAKEDPELMINVEALTQVIPKDLSTGEISVRLGATWIPQEDIQQFITELLTPSAYARNRIKVHYTARNGDWFIEEKASDYGNVKANSTYGTKRASAYHIIEDSLNLRDVRVFDYVLDEKGNRKAILNAKETTAAQAKQEVIKQAFVDWIWKDPERRTRLVRSYNDTFNSVRPRTYDGKHITFGGISPEITLRPHQVNAIAHILYGGNTLLAHKVGAGKTFEMIAAAQESKRLGLCQKSMFVVPNHLVGQWAAEYLRLYPSANILVTTKQDFETGNRKKFCGRIATGDYDAIIIGHSQFERIPMSVERQYKQLEKQLDEIEDGIRDAKTSRGEKFTIKQLMKTRKSIQLKLEKLNDTKRKDNVIDFEELGVDRLFIDESHFYKNLYLQTKMRNVGGIAQTEAQKSSDLFMKCRYLDEITGNRGVIFATGTPISNSMVVRP